MKKKLLVCSVIFLLMASDASALSLLGDSVSAWLSSTSYTVSDQFDSPAIISDSELEFTGQIRITLGTYTMKVDLDLDQMWFDVIFQQETPWSSSGAPYTILSVNIENIDLVDITAVSASEPDWISDIAFTEDSVTANFRTIVSDRTVRFSLEGTSPVPEPATMLLLGVGLVGLAGVTRRKLKK